MKDCKEVVVGVLAFQGAFEKHILMMNSIGVKAIPVRDVNQLSLCDGLIIPGGESPTMMKLIHFTHFEEPFRLFAQKKSVFGTCAGLILMSKEILKDRMKPFGLIDVSVERNAFGRQIESFHTQLNVNLGGDPVTLEAVFIRAPRIRSCGADVSVLTRYENEPVLVQQNRHLAATFHPELTKSDLIHRHFLKLIKEGNL